MTSTITRSALALTVVVLTAVLPASNASAANGCGFGYHRNGMSVCVMNRPGPNAVFAPTHPGCWRNAKGNLRCYPKS